MSDNGYQDGWAPEMKWGCIAAAMVGLPIFCFLLLRDALGDCAPDIPCGKGFLSQVLLPSSLSAIVSGLLVFGVIKIIRRNQS